MTQVFQFTPSATQNFTFQPVLDGALYTITLTFPAYSQRYYLDISDTNGTLIAHLPVLGSPSPASMGGAPSGTSPLFWDPIAKLVNFITPPPFTALPGWSSQFSALVGTTQLLSITGCSPDAYNGIYECLIGQDWATYAMSADPGAVTAVGQVGPALNILHGYFTTSTMVFLSDSQQFVVTP